MDFRSGSPSENSGAEEMEVSLAKPKHRVVSPSPARDPAVTAPPHPTSQPLHGSRGDTLGAGRPGYRYLIPQTLAFPVGAQPCNIP